ncbi:hypothetical protein chiPu_0018051 [Chiloscyllium punctatum]|uniref:39S ribosomal protein L38, mitochondrial n=1 Tax=Chiloscyllium punctatum TaxID=137246 RepID=A0A401RKQ5_CHIPU|nr:hypothetical protein [Chiloscyllium punctatum]
MAVLVRMGAGLLSGLMRSLRVLEPVRTVTGTASEKIDIGLPHFRESRKKQLRERRRITRENHKNCDLERQARHRTLSVSLDEVKAEWERTNGPFHLWKIGEHFAVYRDLFNGATFVPRVMLRIQYDCEDDAVPVYHGNVVTPTEALNSPKVCFEAEEGSLWTLLLTNPDMKEPVFEYDFPPVYHPPQKKYPHGQPLRYLDRYRDSHEPTYGIY